MISIGPQKLMIYDSSLIIVRSSKNKNLYDLYSRFSAKPYTPLMGDQPKERIDIPERAFEHVELDYDGPFFFKKSVIGS